MCVEVFYRFYHDVCVWFPVFGIILTRLKKSTRVWLELFKENKQLIALKAKDLKKAVTYQILSA